MADRKKLQHGSRRAEIVEIATTLFLENGFAATSMATVANAAGLTKASLYHHFPGKDDLFAACVTDGYAAELAILDEIATDPTMEPPDKMRAALAALYRSMTSTPAGRMSPLIAEVSRAFPSVARSFHRDYITPQYAILTQMIDEGVSSGHFNDVNRQLFLHLVFGPIVTLSLSREMFATFDELEAIFPVASLRDGHIDAMLDMLETSAR